MIKLEHLIDEGTIIRLDKLAEALDSISQEEHQWHASILDGQLWSTDRQLGESSYVALDYSNPDNKLCFLFPVVSAALPGFEGSTTVCLHPGAAISTSEGLYPEGLNIMHDALEDWNQFWPPIREAIKPGE